MKLFKKAALLCAALLLCLGLGVAAVACEKESVTSSPQESTESTGDNSSEDGGEDGDEEKDPPAPADYVYRVSVENQGGYGFKNVDVSLKNGDTVVATATTYSSGYAYFEDAESIPVGKYTIELDNVPAGYSLVSNEYNTVELAGTDVTVQIKPNGLLSGKPEVGSGFKYSLGSVMHDFELYDSDGELFKLSTVLKTKKLVVINFWYDGCGPCASEFPVMDNALIEYADTVDCIAISIQDDMAGVANYRKSMGLQLKMAPEKSANLETLFGGVAFAPRTLMIDRYGVVVFDHTGNMTEKKDWTQRFDIFVGDDYVPTVMANVYDGVVDDDDGDDDLVKPNVPFDPVNELKAAFTESNEISFRYQEEKGLEEGMEAYDEYNWPWKIAEETDEEGNPLGKYLYASNKSINGSWAILYAEYTPKAGDVLVFDYKIGSEEGADYLYLIVDGLDVKKLSGNHADKWSTYYYVFQEHEIGQTIQIAFAYIKDSVISHYEDIAYMKNLRLETKADIPPEAGSDAHIFRNAATALNTDENATTQYKNYVEVVHTADDNYYHVGTEDGPILFANMLYASQWSNNSVWMLAYDGYCVVEGFNYRAAFETYAWEANQPMGNYGYTPVTPELRTLLELMVEYVDAYQVWNGEYHENEWLEVCCYYEHFGDEAYEDPMKGITFNAAIEMQLGSNTVNVPYAINPRGFKYKFTPDKSGAYKVYSTGYADTVVFLSTGTTEADILGVWDDKVFVEAYTDENGVEVTDGNFEFYWGFEAGKTYYLMCTTFLDQTATYNVEIEYLGDTYTYLENAAIGPYSTNLITNELFIPDAIDYAYSDPNVDYDGDGEADGDGYYHRVDENGEMAGIIYLDVNRPTPFSNRQSLYDAVRAAEKQADIEKRTFYINGTDYTSVFKQYCFQATVSSSKFGFIEVDADIFDLLRKLTMDTEYDGVSDSWLLLCYYEKTVGIGY